MIHGLMLAAAIDAAAPADADVKERAPESFGRAGSVVLGEMIAARATTPGPVLGFGTQPMYFSAAWVSFGSQRSGDSLVRHLSAEPSFDVFVKDGFSLGARLGAGIIGWESTGMRQNLEQWHLTAMPRVGEAFAVTKDITVWPRFAAGVIVSDSPIHDKVGTAVRASLDVPLVFGISRHVVLQAGPELSYFHQLSGPGDVRGFSGGASAGLSLVL